VIQYLVQPKSSTNATAIEHDNQITLDHLEKFSQSLTARVLIGYIALLLMGFLWLCFIWTINTVFGLSIGKDAMHNVGRFVRRRRRNVAQNNANNNNGEQNNQQVVEQPQVAQNNDGENNNNVDGQQVPLQEQPAANVNVNNNNGK
jgi:Sec-independent protein translocase protein TatA